MAELLFAGDLVIHTSLTDDAETEDGSYDFAPMFGDAAELVASADYATCCLEAVLTGTPPWTGYPLFNLPDEIAYSLAEVGFDLVNTASNHAGGRPAGRHHPHPGRAGRGGARPRGHLSLAGGARREQRHTGEGDKRHLRRFPGLHLRHQRHSRDGFEYAVNVYNHDYMTTLVDVNYDMLDADMAAARALETDVIAVTVHWGAEYLTGPTQYQVSLADYFFAQGADLVIGGHPHVPEPMELRTVTDENGEERTGFLVYCLGNLLSGAGQALH